MSYDPLQVARLVARSAPSPTGCWIWQGAVTKAGYAEAFVGGKVRYVHRVVYESQVRDIEPMMTLDHLCRVRNCINPDHLEPVTLKENVLRGASRAAQAARRNHCAQGHPYGPTPYIHPSGGRRCRICENAWLRTARAKKRAM